MKFIKSRVLKRLSKHISILLMKPESPYCSGSVNLTSIIELQLRKIIFLSHETVQAYSHAQ